MTHLAPEETLTDVRELSEARCRELLEVATVGRLGFVSPAGIQIIPLSYRASQGVLYIKTRPGSAIDQLGEGGREVALEVDYFAGDFGTAWSVLMHGRLETLDATGNHLVDGLRLPVTSWMSGELRNLRFVPRTYTGRVLTRTAA